MIENVLAFPFHLFATSDSPVSSVLESFGHVFGVSETPSPLLLMSPDPEITVSSGPKFQSLSCFLLLQTVSL